MKFSVPDREQSFWRQSFNFELPLPYNVYVNVTDGGDLDSTRVAKPEVHAEDADILVNKSAKS